MSAGHPIPSELEKISIIQGNQHNRGTNLSSSKIKTELSYNMIQYWLGYSNTAF